MFFDNSNEPLDSLRTWNFLNYWEPEYDAEEYCVLRSYFIMLKRAAVTMAWYVIGLWLEEMAYKYIE